jgi:hypothetical protein
MKRYTIKGDMGMVSLTGNTTETNIFPSEEQLNNTFSLENIAAGVAQDRQQERAELEKLIHSVKELQNDKPSDARALPEYEKKLNEKRGELATELGNLYNSDKQGLAALAPQLKEIDFKGDAIEKLIADAAKHKDVAKAPALPTGTAKPEKHSSTPEVSSTAQSLTGSVKLEDTRINAGDAGAKVEFLQEKLEKLGYLDKNGKDGKYGEQTLAAVEKFQEDYNKKHPDKQMPVDGIVGPKTLLAMDEMVAEKNKGQEKPTPAAPNVAASAPLPLPKAETPAPQTQQKDGLSSIWDFAKSMLPPDIKAGISAAETVAGTVLASDGQNQQLGTSAQKTR